MRIDKNTVDEIKALKEKYKVSSKAAFEYLKDRKEYEGWTIEIESQLRKEIGEVKYKPTQREVANLDFLSMVFTGCFVMGPFEADHKLAILNFYRAINRHEVLTPRKYVEATSQLLVHSVRQNGVEKPIIGTYYISPVRDRTGFIDDVFRMTDDLDSIEILEDVIDVVRSSGTNAEAIHLFSNIDFSDDPEDEVKASLDDKTFDKLGIDGFVGPIYFRAERDGTTQNRDIRKTVALNYIVYCETNNVDEAIETALEQLEMEKSPSGNQEPSSYLVEYYEYLIRALKGNRRFLELKMREDSLLL